MINRETVQQIEEAIEDLAREFREAPGLLLTEDDMNRRFAWSLLGFLLAGIFGGIAIYTEFFRDTRPAIQFEVVSNSSVLDVREDVGDLEVVYAGTDLRKSKQSLRVIVVRVTNVGSEDVLKTYYDSQAPLGFAVTHGSLISAEVQGASESYLSQQLSIDIVDPSRAAFSPVILGHDQHFTVKILIIHPESELPGIAPIGRVARVHSITLQEAQTPQPQGFLARAFSGSAFVQLARLPTYFAGFIVLIVAIVVPIATLGSSVGKRRRRKKVRHFKASAARALQEEDDVLFRGYIEGGSSYLRALDTLMSEKTDLDHLVRQAEKHPHGLPWHDDHPGPRVVVSEAGTAMPGRIYLSYTTFVDLLRAGVIEEVEGHHRVKLRFQRLLREFQKFLAIVGD